MRGRICALELVCLDKQVIKTRIASDIKSENPNCHLPPLLMSSLKVHLYFCSYNSWRSCTWGVRAVQLGAERQRDLVGHGRVRLWRPPRVAGPAATQDLTLDPSL